MIKKVSHIGVAVNNLDEIMKVYEEQLGLKVEEIEEVEDQKVRVAMIPVGESRIELLESTHPEGPIAKSIERRGEGLHHIALEVDNIEETLEELKKTGVRMIDEKPRIGAGGAKIAFIHPKTPRLLLELCEEPE